MILINDYFIVYDMLISYTKKVEMFSTIKSGNV